jgi:sulfur carrier protein
VTVVLINGESRELPEEATVDTALAAFGAPENGRGVAVALDGEVVPRGEWSSTALTDGQRLEVLHAVQGGA